MKYLSTMLAVGLTLLVVITVEIFSFLPAQAEPETAEVVIEPLATLPTSALIESSQIEADFGQRETAYQEQIMQLDQTLQDRQSDYQTQIQQMGGQIVVAQNQLNQLQAQAETLSQQTAELETLRVNQIANYQTELAQAQELYNARFIEIQQAIAQAQTRLAEANTKLGR